MEGTEGSPLFSVCSCSTRLVAASLRCFLLFRKVFVFFASFCGYLALIPNVAFTCSGLTLARSEPSIRRSRTTRPTKCGMTARREPRPCLRHVLPFFSFAFAWFQGRGKNGFFLGNGLTLLQQRATDILPS
jgi:hypothetical protein